MSHDLLRKWLQLPGIQWPPNHYVLLGLQLGEGSADDIEIRVLERMELLRHHQLLHPEPVTEGMNFLAQALNCLTDPQARSRYDQSLGIASVSSHPRIEQPPPPPKKDELVLPELDDAPLVRIIELPDAEETRERRRRGLEQSLLELKPPESAERIFYDETVAPPPRQKKDKKEKPIQEVLPEPDTEYDEPLVLEQVPSRKEVSRTTTPKPIKPKFPSPIPKEVPAGTKSPPPLPSLPKELPIDVRREMYKELAKLRKVVRVWERTRGYLTELEKPLDQRSDLVALMACFAELRPLLPTVSEYIGTPNQPGGIVAAITRQPLAVEMFRSLLPSQRDVLAQDCRAAHFRLVDRYQQIRQWLREQLPKKWTRKVAGPVYRVMRRFPEWLSLAAGITAIIVASIRTFGT